MDLKIVAVLFSLIFRSTFAYAGGLSLNFYEQSCPQVEYIVRTSLRSISLTDPTTPAAILRLLFHDCQVQGCDASILLDPESDIFQTEMASGKNLGIRKRETINTIKTAVEALCPQQVSCADILVLAAREAIAMSGGPMIVVPLGRRDSSSPSNFRQADASLPGPNIGLDATLQLFAKKGMTVAESVAILGAHTLGVTHCFNLESRLYKQEVDKIDPQFEIFLKMSCPLRSFTPNSSFIVNDPTTLSFDNQYFVNSINGRGVLRIDAEMPLDPRTAPFIQTFADDQEVFFEAFSSAFAKLSSSNVLTGNQGVIRTYCNRLY
ncbi:peroxidase 29 [Olea europaea var. sylvestris]|uniref:peroxidase 29 n=1 Tax=Olea europaea var. sylvestris TaxID=158386 RepID=UPI000C1D40DB|nr:peroxidase 29 [Olea europaea var. sylvestris]